MGKLYIVSTPIGNLKDITLRAIDVLKSVDVVVCESIKVSKKLLFSLSVQKPLIPLKGKSPEGYYQKVVEELADGKNVAYIVDSGTPCISDPGGTLIKKAIEKGIEVIPIPGPSAILAALVASGLPTDKFTFLGFVPHKKGRKKFIEKALNGEGTVVFYDSPHRIQKTFSELIEASESPKDVQVSVSRELTKKFEETVRGNLGEVNEIIQDKEPRGEYVIVLK